MRRGEIKHQHRKLYVLAGSQEWAFALLHESLNAIPEKNVTWLGTAPEGIAGLEMAKASSLLGTEISYLVFNAWDGFNPDSFAAVAGTVHGGGALVLLCPALAQWPEYADPDKGRYAQYPHAIDDVGHRFIERLIASFEQGAGIQVLHEGQGDQLGLDLLSDTTPDISLDISMTSDQAQAFDAVLRVATGHAKRPLVLQADRGRGKSSLLGWAAAELFRKGKTPLLLTAPNRVAVASLIERLSAELPELKRQGNSLCWHDARLDFVLPDECLGLNPQDYALLMVDEAAAIPAAILKQLVLSHNRVVFSTTVHGYEGSGRGFDIRFREVLNKERPQWLQLYLNTPVRWAENDPLESWLFDVLALKADTDMPSSSDGDLSYRRVSQSELADQPSLLHSVFALLVSAHYQTRPSDLRQLLDATDLRIYLARQQDNVVGVILAIEEGGFAEDLASAVHQGERRPQGHMLAQSLAMHAADAVQMRWLRVMRIAVHPELRRTGVGRAMFDLVAEDAKASAFDGVGTSFGLTEDVYPFWQRCGLLPLRLGVKRDAASGSHSLLMARPLSANADALVRDINTRFQQRLPWELAELFVDLESELVELLLSGRDCSDLSLTDHDLAELRGFAFQKREISSCVFALWKLTIISLSHSSRISLAGLNKQVLLMRAIQHKNDADIAAKSGLSGRRAIGQNIRESVAELLHNELI